MLEHLNINILLVLPLQDKHFRRIVFTWRRQVTILRSGIPRKGAIPAPPGYQICRLLIHLCVRVCVCVSPFEVNISCSNENEKSCPAFKTQTSTGLNSIAAEPWNRMVNLHHRFAAAATAAAGGCLASCLLS